MSSSELQFLEQYDPADFERPSVTVDLVLMSVLDGALHALLLHREQHPHKGKWALPGGFVKLDESLDEAAKRILKDKARVGSAYLEQLYTFGEVKRDPRMRIITVAYFALLPPARFESALKLSSELTLAQIEVPWKGETGARQARLQRSRIRAFARALHAQAAAGRARSDLERSLQQAGVSPAHAG